MAYRIEVSPLASRQLKKLDAETSRKIGRKIDSLGVNPRPPGVEKLAGTGDLWRVRVGDYRIIYQIHDKRLLVLVVKVGDRKDIYR